MQPRSQGPLSSPLEKVGRKREDPGNEVEDNDVHNTERNQRIKYTNPAFGEKVSSSHCAHALLPAFELYVPAGQLKDHINFHVFDEMNDTILSKTVITKDILHAFSHRGH